MREIVIFSGSAHPELAAESCEILGVPLSSATFHRFSNDCLYAQLKANCRERDVFIFQPLVPPVQDHLMELFLMMDAARGASAARITAVIPHYAYARSDKKDAPRISIAGRLVADLLVTAGANRVLTMALHSPQVDGFFNVPVDHLNALPLFKEYFSEYDLSNTVVVSPDFGNAKPSSHLARLLGVPVAAGNKRRQGDDRVVIDTLVGNVEGKDVIILDDEIANGGTTVEILRVVREHNAREIRLVCTHALLTGRATERLSSQTDIAEIVVTNTVPITAEKRLQNMKIISVAPLLAEAIRRIHNGESISTLFID
jgi:ribose-phosphate pyrophosphokinase